MYIEGNAMPLFVPVSAPSNQYIPFLLSRKSSILYSLPASEIFVKNRLLFKRLSYDHTPSIFRPKII